jgi:hypothetical protein
MSNLQPRNLHQTFVSRHELLASIALHARSLAFVVDQNIGTDLSLFDVRWVKQTSDRITELTQAFIEAGIAEEVMRNGQHPQATVTCDLTLSSPDGATK